MTTLKAWIAAARLRTLPLSVSGVIVGSAFGNSAFQMPEGITNCFGFYPIPVYKSPLFWLAIAVTIGFQILSNFANDYGDGIKGTDANRQGEKRMVASGLISPKQMKIGMIITGAITFFLATILIFGAFGNENFILFSIYIYI